MIQQNTINYTECYRAQKLLINNEPGFLGIYLDLVGYVEASQIS